MSRTPRAGGRYVAPIDGNGVTLTTEGPQGVFTLSANTTYYYVIGGAEAPVEAAHLTGYDAGLVITSASVQDSNHDEVQVTNHSAVVGEWVTEDPTTAFVGVDGTGWSASNGEVAASGGGVGGAMFHIGDTGAFRTRIAVVVGAAGGKLRVSAHGKC